MECKVCRIKVRKVEGSSSRFEPVDRKLVARRYGIPFRCSSCGAIKFPYRAITAFVFIWPLSYFEEQSKSKVIIIPKHVQKLKLSDFGIILSAGPGYRRKGKFYPTPEEICVGRKVLYDKTVPGHLLLRGVDRREHEVILCGVADVTGVVE